MKVKAMRDEVLVRRIVKEKTKSGLIIPDAVKSCTKGEVVSVGKRIDKNGNIEELEVTVGDTVLFPKATGQELDVGDEKLVMIKHEDILGKIVEE